METKKWQSLIKAAKPNSKKVLAYLGCKPTPAPSSSKPEVQLTTLSFLLFSFSFFLLMLSPE
jgi:hypothetical protein